MSQAFRRLLALAAVFLIAFTAVAALRTFRNGGTWRDLLPGRYHSTEFRPEQFTLPQRAPLEIADVELLARMNEEYARLTGAVVPSVVSINTLGRQTRNQWYPTQGQGSGVIVTHEGHVVTNHHVVADQSQIHVTLHGGRSYPATLIGEDRLLDIAVIKIQAADETFVPLKLGDSSQVQVGQMVFAVGNPFGLGETVTSGIISAKERSLSDNQRDLFQTDAAINPGNSGGPLVNLQGEIIGINVAIYTMGGERTGFQGVGFSIPSNDVRYALEQILERGQPVRGFLGVKMINMSGEVREFLGYAARGGAAVDYVIEKSPAEAAGLKPHDVVVAYQGQPIESVGQFITLVQRTRIGTEVSLRVWRAGKLLDLTATVGESPTFPMISPVPGPDGGSRSAEAMLVAAGILARDLTVQERQRGFQGVVVTEVTPEGLAANSLERGDVIVGINGVRTDTLSNFYLHLAASVAVRPTVLHIFRNGRMLQVELPQLRTDE
jgi:serine protease Do